MFFILILLIFDRTSNITIPLTCGDDCGKSFGTFILGQTEIVYNPYTKSYDKDYAIMPGFAGFSQGNEKIIKIKKIYKRGYLDTELSYIYPKILKGIIQEIQKRRINQKNKNIITKPETLPITTIKENESTSSHDNNKVNNYLPTEKTNTPPKDFKTQSENLKKDENKKTPEISTSPSRLRGISQQSLIEPTSKNTQQSQIEPSSKNTRETSLNEKEEKPSEPPIQLFSPPINLIRAIPNQAPTQVNQPALIETNVVDTPLSEKPISLKEKNYAFKHFTGTFFIYTYSSPCLYCLEKIISLTKLFPNLLFNLYYSSIYDNKTILRNYFSEQRDDEIINSFYFRDECVKLTNQYLFKRYAVKRGREQSDEKEFNAFWNCVQEKYQNVVKGIITLKNIKFVKVLLRLDIGVLSSEIQNYNYNSY